MKKAMFKKLLSMVVALAMVFSVMTVVGVRDTKAATSVGTITAVGAGSGNFLNGAQWDPGAHSNDMTEIATDVWEITYMNVDEGTYEFKFAADNDWAVSFGTGAAMDSGAMYTAYRGGDNSTITVSAASNVTLRLDLTGYSNENANGGKMAVLIVPVEEYELTGDGDAPLTDTVTYDVTNMSFSGVDYKYQYCQYITTLVPMPGYKLPDSINISVEGTGDLTQGTGYNYDSSTGAITILGGVNSGTVTITAAAVEDVAYTVAGDAGLCGEGWNPSANSMTNNGDGTYSITFASVPTGTYGFKVTDGTWNNSWGDNGENYYISIGTECDVTITFNSSTKAITVSGSGLVDYLLTNMSIAGTGLFGADWTPVAMTETSTDIWEYTIENVAAGSYSYKYTADTAWAHSWGNDGWYNSSENYSVTVPYDGSKVTFRVDLTGVNMSDPGAVRLTATSVTVTPGSYTVTLPTDANITATGNTSVTAGTEYTATLSAASGYVLPTTITVTIGGVACDDFTYNSTTGVVTIPADCVTGAIVITATAVQDLPDTYEVTFPTDANISTTGNTTATEEVEYTATLSAASGYLLPTTITVTIGGVACDDFAYNSTTGVVTIPADCVTGEIVITATAVQDLPDTYDVTFPTDANISTTGNTTATEEVEYTATLSAASGYLLPTTITVTISGVACDDFTYNSTTGVVTIPADCVTGAIVITATAVADTPDEYDVTPPTDSNITYTGDMTATEGENYIITLSAASGYSLPDSITVTIGGVACDDFTYNKATGAVTIPAACVTGDVVISATAVQNTPSGSSSVYVVAGESELCGDNWSASSALNQMGDSGDGTFSIGYANVPVNESDGYEFKIVKDGTEWIGNGGNNYIFYVTSECQVNITYNPTTGEVTITGSGVSLTPTAPLVIDSVTAVGNGADGSTWLNGKNWAQDASDNHMTEVEEDVYEITFEDIVAGEDYQVKFAINDAWDVSFGSSVAPESGVWADAVKGGGNIVFASAYDLADVTITLDLTNYDNATGTGARFMVEIVEDTSVPAGDTNVVVWVAIALIAVAGIAGIAIANSKKRIYE